MLIDRFNEFVDDFSNNSVLEEPEDYFGLLGLVLAFLLFLSPASSLAQSAAAPPEKKEQAVSAELQHVREKLKGLGKKYDVSKIGERGIGGGLNFYSMDSEIRLGQSIAVEVDQQSKILHDPVVNEYINRLAQNLVRNSDARVPFTVKVLENDEINAFALPGGFFYVNTGLILAAENEAELAGVMAHEIGHVAARHATKQATKHNLFSMATIPLVFVGGPAGMIARNVVQLAVPMTYMKFSRGAEREADLLGLEYQYATGYDPTAVVQFFERVQAGEKKKKGFIARAFSSHPMTDDRVKRTQQAIDALLPEREQYLMTTSEFEDIKARVRGLTSAHLMVAPEEVVSDKPVLKKRERQQ